MFHRLGGKRHGGRARRGQGMVEFALCVPVFLFMIFGIFQAALIYKTQLALNQAAMDAAQVISAQSSDGPPSGGLTQTDAPGLNALRAGLITLNFSNLDGHCLDGTSSPCSTGNSPSGIDVFSDDGNGNAKSEAVNNSNDLQGGPFDNSSNISKPYRCLPSDTFDCLSLDNHYTYSPSVPGAPSGPRCPVDLDQSGNFDFALVNSLDNPSPTPSSAILKVSSKLSGETWSTCSLPWNGQPFDNTSGGNQNGRHDQRCDEETVTVKIRYNYFSAAFPIHWGIQLVGTAALPLEPRQYIGNNATVQTQVGVCG